MSVTLFEALKQLELAYERRRSARADFKHAEHVIDELSLKIRDALIKSGFVDSSDSNSEYQFQINDKIYRMMMGVNTAIVELDTRLMPAHLDARSIKVEA